MNDILFMNVKKGDLFRPDTGVIYEALSDPEPGDDEGHLMVQVQRISGADTVTGIKHTEPGADWTDVHYNTMPVPKFSEFQAAWDEPVTLVRRLD